MKLTAEQYSGIRLKILRSLVRHNIWGAKHNSYELMQKGLPKHLRGFGKEVTDNLIREGILLSHPTSYGLQISLNPERAKEIKEILEV